MNTPGAEAQLVPTPAQVAAREVARSTAMQNSGPRSVPDDAQWLLHSGASVLLAAGLVLAMSPSEPCRYVDDSENVRLRRSIGAFLGAGAAMAVAGIVRAITSASHQPRRLSGEARGVLHALLAVLSTGTAFTMLLLANGGAVFCNS